MGSEGIAKCSKIHSHWAALEKVKQRMQGWDAWGGGAGMKLCFSWDNFTSLHITMQIKQIKVFLSVQITKKYLEVLKMFE